jgi:hypothetical protein
MRDVSVIVTVLLSADSTVTGSFEFGLSITGNLKSEDAMTIGRIVSLDNSEVGIFELVLEFVQAEIVRVKQVTTRATFEAHFTL